MKFYSFKDYYWYTVKDEAAKNFGQKLIKVPGAARWAPRISVSEFIYGPQTAEDKARIAASAAVKAGTALHREIEEGTAKVDYFAHLGLSPLAQESFAHYQLGDGRMLVGGFDALSDCGTVIDFKTVSFVRSPKQLDNYRKQLSLYGRMIENTYRMDVNKGLIVQISADTKEVLDVHEMTTRGLKLTQRALLK